MKQYLKTTSTPTPTLPSTPTRTRQDQSTFPRRSRTSDRTRQRQKIKQIRKLTSYYNNFIHNLDTQLNNDINYNINNACLREFGFIPNLNLSIHQNIINVVGDMTPHHYLIRPTKATYHNFCQNENLPSGTEGLIGLGLKFCLESPRPNQDIILSNKQITRAIRIHFFLKKILR